MNRMFSGDSNKVSNKINVKFGVGVRLFLAFTSTVCLAAVSAGITIKEFAYTSEQLDTVRDQNVPSLVEGSAIVRSSTAIVSTLPALRSAKNSQQLNNALSLIDSQIALMTDYELSPDHVTVVTELRALIARFVALKSATIKVKLARQSLTQETHLGHAELIKQLGGMIDDLQFNVIIGSEQITTRNNPIPTFRKLIDGDVTTLRDLAELKAEVHLAEGLLIQGAIAQGWAEIIPIKERFTASSDEINRLLSVAPKKYSKDINPGINKLLGAGEGINSLFVLRGRELDGEAQLINLAKQLTQEVNVFIAQFDHQSVQIANDIRQRFEELQTGFAATEQKLMLITELSLLLSSVIMLFYVWRGLTRRLQILAQAMQSIAAGRYDIEPNLTGADEITVMAYTVKELRDTAYQAQQLRSKLADQFDTSVRKIIGNVNLSSDKVHGATKSLDQVTREVSQRSLTVSQITDTNLTNIQSVSTATHKLSESISAIEQRLQDATTTTKRSVEAANLTAQTMQKLEHASIEIDSVRQLISGIAEQTNLLALNATIEASRAGAQGRGFAVVAKEVKMLAVQTTKATGDIAKRVQDVQNATQEASNAIEFVVSSIEEVEQSAYSIAESIGEQSEATESIVHSVCELEESGVEIRKNVEQVSQSATDASRSIQTLGGLADNLLDHSRTLENSAGTFVDGLRQQPDTAEKAPAEDCEPWSLTAKTG